MCKNENLILIHGLPGWLSFFNPEELLPEIKVMCPDLHGYGNSHLKENLPLQDQVDFAKQFVEGNFTINDAF